MVRGEHVWQIADISYECFSFGIQKPLSKGAPGWRKKGMPQALDSDFVHLSQTHFLVRGVGRRGGEKGIPRGLCVTFRLQNEDWVLSS